VTPLSRLAALAGSLLAALAVAAPAHATAPGVNISDYGDTPVALSEGAKQIRFFVRWSDFEPNGPSGYTAQGGAADQNVFVRGLSDGVRQTLDAGATPILVVLGAPDWAASNGHPRSSAEYASFIGELASNLAPLRQGKGTIAYEVWNEPDAPEFWGETPDPDFYTAMLKASYAAIKADDPGATVIAGPTTGNDFAWIEALYARGAKGSFDGVAVHTDTACSVASPDSFYRGPDGRLGQYTFLGYREVRASMLANGDDKPIWMSELGWSTTKGGPTSCARGAQAGKKPSGVDEATQAQFLNKAYECLAHDDYVVGATWFTLRDAQGSASSEGSNYGLLRRDGSGKPSLAAFKRANGAQPGSCGDFQPPSLNVISPIEGQQYSDRLDLDASATDSGVGLGRITYAYDGVNKIRNFTDNLLDGKAFGLSPWYSSSSLGLGPHTVDVTALDKNGNTVTKTVHITRVAPGTLKSTLTPTVRLARRVTCSKRSCTLNGAVSRSPGGSSVGGKAAVEWQWKNKQGRFTKLVGGLKPANKAFVFAAKLRKSGTWRVRVLYHGVAPYKSTGSKSLVFHVK